MKEDRQKVLGPYEVIRLLGAGGMGEVFLAYDPRLDRRVAIKRIRTDHAGDRHHLSRFRREARLVAGLRHPAIVQVHDLLTLGDREHIVMEYVPGESLRARIKREGPLPLADGLRIARAVAEGLAYAHGRQVIHRDLKSENVLVTLDGEAKIADFGIARRTGGQAHLEDTLTLSGALLGTYRAMSPQQLCGDPVDARSDLFSFGVLLYEVFTGQSPFHASTDDETMQRVLHHAPAPVLDLVQVPPPLSALIGQLLEKQPLLRPRDAEEVAACLGGLAEQVRHDDAMTFGLQSPVPAGSTDDSGTGGSAASGSRPSQAIRTLLLTDFVSSTRLVAELGDRRFSELDTRCDQVARDLMARHAGREIDKSDGFLVLFERPIEAVRWALGYHRALDDLARQEGVEVKARVGIHLGEVLLRENPPDVVRLGAKPLEVEGLAKASAARVMHLAGGGQTLLTRGAFDLAQRAAADASDSWGADRELCWLSHGTYRLEGVGGETEVCEVGVAGRSPLRPPVNVAKARRASRPGGRLGLGTGIVLALLVLVALAWLGPLTRTPPTPRTVAVLKPRLEVGSWDDPKEMFSFTVRNALLRALTSYQNLSPKTTSEVDAITGSPVEVARGVAADEVLVPTFACRDQTCFVKLDRVSGEDGSSAQSIQVDTHLVNLLTTTQAMRVALGRLYPKEELRFQLMELEISVEDFNAYRDIQRKYYERGIETPAIPALLDELEELRRRSSDFVDTYLLEAEVAVDFFRQTREATYLHRALDLLEEARSLAPDDPDVLFKRVYVDIQARRLDDAEATLQVLNRLVPGDVRLLDKRADILDKRGEVAQALALSSTALARQPSWERYYLHSQLAYRHGDVAAARESAEALLDLSPGNPRGLFMIARLELNNGDPSRAAELYSQLISRSPHPAYFTNMGLAHMFLRQHTESAQAFESALELGPHNPIYVLNLADARWLEGRREEAVPLYRRTLELIARDPAIGAQQLTMRAQALAHLGQNSDAVESIQEALRMAPEDGLVAFEAALVYTLVGDRTAAVVNVRRSLNMGRTPQWFDLPWFDELRSLPEFTRLLAGDSG